VAGGEAVVELAEEFAAQAAQRGAVPVAGGAEVRLTK
jgi:hypothetical protein